MIEKFTKKYFNNLQVLKEKFQKKHPNDYKELVKNVIEILTDDSYDAIDPDRIHEINDGDYQGTLVYVIASKDCQPSKYYYCRINYGSCGACDTLQGIKEEEDGITPNEEQVKAYMQLACHVVQQLREMGGEVV